MNAHRMRSLRNNARKRRRTGRNPCRCAENQSVPQAADHESPYPYGDPSEDSQELGRQQTADSQMIPDTVLIAWRDALKAAVEQERERCAQIAEEHAHVCAEAVDALKGLKQNGNDFQIAAECASNIAKKIREGR